MYNVGLEGESREIFIAIFLWKFHNIDKVAITPKYLAIKRGIGESAGKPPET